MQTINENDAYTMRTQMRNDKHVWVYAAPWFFLSTQALTRVHAALLVSRNITDVTRPSNVQLCITQSRRPLHVGVASFDSLAASEIFHNSNHFTHKFFIPVKVFGQINNRIATIKTNVVM